MSDNKHKIAEIDNKIAELQKEKERLKKIDSLPEIERKIQEYLSKSYSGKRLSEKHSMDEEGFWKIKGEDPNCDLGGSHYQPDLGIVEGTLKEALLYALGNPNFYTWGGGGDIEKINIIRPGIVK